MIAHPVSRYLTQFGIEKEAGPSESFDGILQPLSARVEEGPEENPEALLEAAREEGRTEGRAAAQLYFETILANQKRDYEKRLGEERNSWVNEEGAKLSLCLTDAIAQLEERLAECVDAVLRPFLIESLRRQMIDELVSDVGVLLASDETPAIEISGAADLLAILQTKLSSAPVAIDYKPNESIDVRIVAHHTIIESQLRAWIERFDPAKESD
jgi:hypothetical protein